MAQRIETRAVSCAAQITQANAIETDLTFSPGVVTEIEIVIPNGHMGATGIAIAQAHQIVVPYTGELYIIGNDDRLTWQFQDFLNSGSWSAFTYNLGRYSHAWYLRFMINEIAPPIQTTLPAPIPAERIAA